MLWRRTGFSALFVPANHSTHNARATRLCQTGSLVRWEGGMAALGGAKGFRYRRRIAIILSYSSAEMEPRA
jgi:hypothetical protein